jgi:hypothetical protein
MLKNKIKQRIAVVAVSALTAGLFSIVNMSTASAAELAVGVNETNTAFTADTMFVANRTHATTLVASATLEDNESVGLRLYDSSVGTNATQVATMKLGGGLVLMTGAATGDEVMFNASGGSLAAGVGGGEGTVTYNAAGTPTGRAANTLAYSDDDTTTSVEWTPAAVGTYTIRMYTDAVESDFSNATAGTLRTTLTVYVGTASDLEVNALGTTATTSRGIISTNGVLGHSGSSTFSPSSAPMYGSTTNYGVTLSSGSVYVKQIAGAATGGIKVVGGTFSSCLSATGTTSVLNTAMTECTNTTTTDTLAIAVPNSGATSMSITGYTTSALTTAQSAITYSIVAAATTNAFSSSKSFISVEETAATADSNIDATRTDAVDGATYSATEVPAGAGGFLGYDLKDAYGTALSGHVLGASVTGGCFVGFNQATSANIYSAASTTTASGYISVGRPVSTGAYTCTLTFTDNGTTIASRTFKFLGQAASIKVTSVKNVKTGAAANDAAFKVDVLDSAGNALDNITWSVTSSYLNAGLTTVTAQRVSDRDNTATTTSHADVTCLTAGTYDLSVKATNASLATITSPVFKISCAGDPESFTASLDKATYAPGEIATLTITAKDSAGNLTNDYAVLGTAGAAATEASLTGGMLTIIGQTTAALLNAVKFSSGVAKFKFTVGATAGSYNLVVDLPAYPDAAGKNQAQTVSYKVGSDGAVSNADVLKSIVALIASINKQIQALQKLILKR